jgi:outer membrane protein assembly factor BamA
LGTYLNKGFKLRSFKKVLFGALLFTAFSCNITKNLKENEYLVSSNKIVDHEKTKVTKDAVEAYIRQKPNRKLLFVFPFNLWLYNQVDKEKLAKKKEKRDARFDRINEKRIAKNQAKNEKRAKKGKPAKEPKLKNKDKPTFRESVLDVGEPPVIYDSAIAKQTALQMKKYLFSKGYFYGRTSDSVEYNKVTKRAKVSYHLFPGKQYFIHNIKYSFTDEELAYYIFSDTIHSKLKRGAPYDEDVFQAERERITTYLLNNGYYYFEPDYIYFDVDSALSNQMVNVTVSAKKFPVFANEQKDSISYVKHPRYYINNIYIITENLKGSYKNEYFKDSIREEDFLFLANHPLRYRKTVITNNIEFFKGQLFQKNLAEKTYKRLLNLRVFRTVNIQFVRNQLYSDQLDCYIICSPLIKQAISIETEVTNTQGNYGLDGSLLYQDKNLLRGAELLELRLSGAVIAQKQFNTTQQTDINKVNETFNTIQFGPSMKFSVPRVVFPFSIFPFRKDAFPQTFINTSLNYQSRLEFTRVITDVDYGFSFRSNKSKLKHDLIPVEVYLVKATLQSKFRQDLINGGDFFLLNSFQDHITTVSKYALTYNNQTVTEGTNTSKKAVSYVKVTLSSSGNILRGLYELTGQKQDTAGRYLIFNTPFAQFLKMDIDYRLYIPVRKKSRVVYRTMLGIGKPLKNLNVLPYEQSYFSGGPNSVRAWRARTLGPGGYSQPANLNARYDKIGDFIIEGNIEYRFHVFRSFYGAIFADGGNIWLLHKDASKPNGDLEFNRFYKEFALGSGLGVRWDLSFFVLRLDAAVPIADPSYPEGDRWMFNKQPLKRITLNFGIGYPF